MPWIPRYEGERPTLGHYAAEWMVANLARPDLEDYEPFYPTIEQYEFLLNFYEIDPITGRRLVRRGVLSRSRGWGKSPFSGGIAIVEALADIVPDGWDADGWPVGKPWRSIRTPDVFVAAASEDQTENAYRPILEMLHADAAVHDNYPGMDPMAGRVNLPGRGGIWPVTSSVTSTKGKRPVFTLMDQTEQWNSSNKGKALAKVLRANATKTGSSILETPNAFTPGEGSVAEDTAKAFQAQIEGRTALSHGLLVDHREAPADTDLTERESLVAGIRYTYGCSSAHPDGCVLPGHDHQPGWVETDAIIEHIWDLDAEEQDSRGDWLNQITHASDSWISAPEWTACRDWDTKPRPGDAITLGFDGSRGRAKGKPDATALVACRVSDGHCWPVDIWEAPDKRDEWATWEPPLGLIEDAIETTFNTYRVVGFYCDPARDWRSYVNKWEARYSRRVPIKAGANHPFEFWMLGGQSTKVEVALESVEGAIRNGDMSHAGHDGLTRHVLNARRRLSRGRLKIEKQASYSPEKIDAAVALTLAWAARQEAVTRGYGHNARNRAPGRPAGHRTTGRGPARRTPQTADA